MIKGLDQVKNLLRKCQGTWAWVGQRGVDAYGVLDFIPIDTVFCCDFGESYFNLWDRESLFSVEKEIGKRENWGNRDLEKLWEGPTRKRIEAFIEKRKAPINTICYRSLRVLEQDRRFRVLAPALKLKDMFDDKLRQLDLFARLGIKTPKTYVCRLNETTFSEARDGLGGPFVVQPPVGSSGENTYFVTKEADFDSARVALGSHQRVKLSKYIPVPSLNGHGVVLKTSQGLHSLAVCPSVQIVGVHGCTDRAEIYCGNDFSAAASVSKSVRDEICTIMENVGRYMGSKGFLGVFGMDFLLNQEEVLALEINPRFQGSTMMLSLLQLDREEIPLSALHVMQFMGLIEAFPRNLLEQLNRMYRTPYTGAHLIVHSLEENSCRIEHNLKPGVHTLVGETIRRIRNGTTYRDLESPEEWCIIDNLPLQSTEIFKEARFAMIQTRNSILDSNLRQLDSYTATYVKELHGLYTMIPL